jgi:hypothetical protein
MMKLLSLLFVLVSVNCNAIAHELKEFLISEESISPDSKMSVQRLIIVIDKLEETQDPMRKEILKVNLSIEASMIESHYTCSINCFQSHVEWLEVEIAESITKDNKESLKRDLQKFKEYIVEYRLKIQFVQQIVDELTYH